MHWITHGENQDEAPKKEEQHSTPKAALAFTSNAADAGIRTSSSPLVAEAADRHRRGDHCPHRPLAVGEMTAPTMPSKRTASRTGVAVAAFVRVA